MSQLSSLLWYKPSFFRHIASMVPFFFQLSSIFPTVDVTHDITKLEWYHNSYGFSSLNFKLNNTFFIKICPLLPFSPNQVESVLRCMVLFSPQYYLSNPKYLISDLTINVESCWPWRSPKTLITSGNNIYHQLILCSQPSFCVHHLIRFCLVYFHSPLILKPLFVPLSNFPMLTNWSSILDTILFFLRDPYFLVIYCFCLNPLWPHLTTSDHSPPHLSFPCRFSPFLISLMIVSELIRQP